MDPTTIARWLNDELAVASHASFWVAIFAASFVIWRAMEWRYGGVIARLESQVEHAESVAAKSKPPGDRKAIREKLGDFLERGVALQNRAGEKEEPLPMEDAEAWFAEVQEYLRQVLDKSFVARLNDDSCVPQVYTSVAEDRVKLWGVLRAKVWHLQEFIREMA